MKFKMFLYAAAALFGSGAAYATHRQTVETPPCSQIDQNFHCEDAVVSIHCCKDDLTGQEVYGPLTRNPQK